MLPQTYEQILHGLTGAYRTHFESSVSGITRGYVRIEVCPMLGPETLRRLADMIERSPALQRFQESIQ